ncbi:hypothetical protein [Kitasatospora sp. NPDC088134]|uniref:hypothetical protein n=1 Tax=Kitasatospora sp. NPDC088134 TaxID=3364071 RepID=UPI0037FAEA01
MTSPTTPNRSVWKCADCDTNNLSTDSRCIVCDNSRPVSRVRSSFPAPAAAGSGTPSAVDPMAAASALWRQLTEHQPAVAAALAMQLRGLPESWAQRELGLARPHAALELAPAGGLPVEVAPYSADWENCPACAESGELCRYHDGWAAGHEALHQPLLEAVRLDPTVTVKDALARLADAEEAAESGELASAVERLTGGEG